MPDSPNAAAHTAPGRLWDTICAVRQVLLLGESAGLRYGFCSFLKSDGFWPHLTTTEFALILNSEVGPLISTNLWVHGRSLKFALCFQAPLVLAYLEQTAVVRVTLATKRLRGYQVLKLVETLSK